MRYSYFLYAKISDILLAWNISFKQRDTYKSDFISVTYPDMELSAWVSMIRIR